MSPSRRTFDDHDRLQGQNLLGETLKHYRTRAPMTIAQVATEVGIDRVYLWRLETQDADWLHRPLDGEAPRQPSRDLIIRIAFALRLDLDEADELLMAAGYAPLWNPVKPVPVPPPAGKRRRV